MMPCEAELTASFSSGEGMLALVGRSGPLLQSQRIHDIGS